MEVIVFILCVSLLLLGNLLTYIDRKIKVKKKNDNTAHNAKESN